ncbi:MAG: histidinol-phosphate transaminase [Gammaproteobacteria bacterium]
MSRYWSEATQLLSPYVPGEQPKKGTDVLKLNTNEHPYGPSPRVLEAIAQATNNSLRLYPDPDSQTLRKILAEYVDVVGVTENEIFVGNGSDEVLAHIFCALLKHEKPILFPDITYSFYPVYCGLYGVDYQTIPLDAEFGLKVSDYNLPNGGIIFANPNAPTGKALPLADITCLLRNNPDSVVVIDEAYVDFGAESATKLVAKYPQLLVVQTLSKSRALAGMRIGFAIGDRGLIEGLNRVKNSFNSYPLDRLAQAAAQAAIEDNAYFEAMRHCVMDARQWLTEALAERDFETLPSAANFILTAHRAVPGKQLFNALRSRNILVRYFNAPRLEKHVRITIGSQAQCETLVRALDDILQDA